MMKSESIKGLAEALAKAQGELKPAQFDCVNPFFKSKYASLASVTASCKEALSKNGLAVTQIFSQADGRPVIETCLMHSSGEWVCGQVPIIMGKQDMQGLGAATTYARRIGLSSILGIVADSDDDGGSTADRSHGNTQTHPVSHYHPTVEAPKLESYIIPFGKKFIGKKMVEIPKQDIQKYLDWLQGELEKSGEQPNNQVRDFMLMADQYLA